MTVPAIFFSTGSVLSASLGAGVAATLAYKKKSLIVVAASAALTVLVTELVVSLF